MKGYRLSWLWVPNTLSGLELSGLDPEDSVCISQSQQRQDQWHRWGGCLFVLGCAGEMPLKASFL